MNQIFPPKRTCDIHKVYILKYICSENPSRHSNRAMCDICIKESPCKNYAPIQLFFTVARMNIAKEKLGNIIDEYCKNGTLGSQHLSTIADKLLLDERKEIIQLEEEDEQQKKVKVNINLKQSEEEIQPKKLKQIKDDQWKNEQIIEFPKVILSLSVNSCNVIALTSSEIQIYSYDSDLCKYTLSCSIEVAPSASKTSVICAPFDDVFIYNNLDKQDPCIFYTKHQVTQIWAEVKLNTPLVCNYISIGSNLIIVWLKFKERVELFQYKTSIEKNKVQINITLKHRYSTNYANLEILKMSPDQSLFALSKNNILIIDQISQLDSVDQYDLKLEKIKQIEFSTNSSQCFVVSNKTISILQRVQQNTWNTHKSFDCDQEVSSICFYSNQFLIAATKYPTPKLEFFSIDQQRSKGEIMIEKKYNFSTNYQIYKVVMHKYVGEIIMQFKSTLIVLKKQ